MALFSIQDALIKFVYEEVALYELYFGRTFTASNFINLLLKIIKTEDNFKNTLSFFNGMLELFVSFLVLVFFIYLLLLCLLLKQMHYFFLVLFLFQF